MRLVWLLALLLVPGVAAQSGIFQAEPADARLYIHVNGFQDAPMSTNPAPAWHTESADLGLAQHSQGCVATPGSTLVSEPHHTFYAFTTPSNVWYDDQESNPRYTNERGLSYDLQLEANSTPHVRWILESQITTAENEANQVSPVVPRTVMRATLRESIPLTIEVGQGEYNDGRIIAQGQSSPADLHPVLLGNNPDVAYTQVGDKHLYDFNFDLKLLDQSPIRADAGFNLRIDLFMEIPCGQVEDGEYIMPDFVRSHSSDGFRPHLDLAVSNPIHVSSIAAQIIGDDVVTTASIQSVWGDYDIQSGGERDSAKAFVNGPGVSALEMNLFAEGREYTHVHGSSQNRMPAQFVWLWEDASDAAQAGQYVFNFTIENDQQNAKATGAGTFDVGAGTGSYCSVEDKGTFCTSGENLADNTNTPGIGLLAPLLMALLWRRR